MFPKINLCNYCYSSFKEGEYHFCARGTLTNSSKSLDYRYKCTACGSYHATGVELDEHTLNCPYIITDVFKKVDKTEDLLLKELKAIRALLEKKTYEGKEEG